LTDTIAAIATGGGISAIGVVRVSGSGAIAVADKVFRAASGTGLADAEDRRMYYGELRGADGELIDLCLCAVSRGPGSYTGEDTVELHCHGAPVVLSEALRALYQHGVRHAGPGEFTKRAFLNGRLDMAQAEAVIDLIESDTPIAARSAACQLRGAIGEKLAPIYGALLGVMAHFHAVVDYPDEDIDEFDAAGYLPSLSSAEEELSRMLFSHERGKVLRDGIPTAIVGRTNSGKSSLLNALLGYDRAIVTEIPGTTRDTIEEKALIGGIPLRLIDTAGFREAQDAVESLGVARTRDALLGAGLAILVLDGSEPLRGEDFFALSTIPQEVPRIITVNKSDLPQVLGQAELSGFGAKSAGARICRISALTGEGLDALGEKVRELFPELSAPPTGEMLTNARQAEAISRARESVALAIEAIGESVTPDAVLTELEAALAAIGEVTGKTMREDIVARIFERFCVGK